jgi:hypothetical protein
MDAMTLNDVIETAMKLPAEQRDMLVEILRSRQIAAHRQEIAVDAAESVAEFRAGRLSSQPLDEILAELHRAIEDEE